MSTAHITTAHHERMAYVYVRQSTLWQVNEHQESTERQYRLQERALQLGWPPTAIEVIDEDQGRSGSSATTRTGFQRLVSEVSLGRIGMVLMLEASRLARNSSDWHQLIELCGYGRRGERSPRLRFRTGRATLTAPGSSVRQSSSWILADTISQLESCSFGAIATHSSTVAALRPWQGSTVHSDLNAYWFRFLPSDRPHVSIS